MWTLIVLVTSGPNIASNDYSVPMSFVECQQAAKEARAHISNPAGSDRSTAVVIYCKKSR